MFEQKYFIGFIIRLSLSYGPKIYSYLFLILARSEEDCKSIQKTPDTSLMFLITHQPCKRAQELEYRLSVTKLCIRNQLLKGNKGKTFLGIYHWHSTGNSQDCPETF